MEDREFNELRVKMAFVPTAERWPDQHVHWKALREAALEARSRVSKTYAQMGEIDLNPDLTPQGKATERAKVATRALAEAEASKSLENARAAVDRMMNKWAEKLGNRSRPPKISTQ